MREMIIDAAMARSRGFPGSGHVELQIGIALFGVLLAIAVPNVARVRREEGRHACAARIMERARAYAARRTPTNVEPPGAAECPVSGDEYDHGETWGDTPAETWVFVRCRAPERHAAAGEEPPALSWSTGDPDLAEAFPEPSAARKALAYGACAGAALMLVLAIIFAIGLLG
jgi:hypothetical protein